MRVMENFQKLQIFKKACFFVRAMVKLRIIIYVGYNWGKIQYFYQITQLQN